MRGAKSITFFPCPFSTEIKSDKAEQAQILRTGRGKVACFSGEVKWDCEDGGIGRTIVNNAGL